MKGDICLDEKQPWRNDLKVVPYAVGNIGRLGGHLE